MRRLGVALAIACVTIFVSACSSDSDKTVLGEWAESKEPDCTGGFCSQWERSSPEATISVLPWGAPYDFPPNSEPVELGRGEDRATYECYRYCRVWVTIDGTGWLVMDDDGVMDKDHLVAFASKVPFPGPE